MKHNIIIFITMFSGSDNIPQTFPNISHIPQYSHVFGVSIIVNSVMCLSRVQYSDILFINILISSTCPYDVFSLILNEPHIKQI